MRKDSQDPEVAACATCQAIPISHLSLDLPEPVVGWERAFSERGVEIILDDVGRPSVPRHVLGELLAEHRERETRRAERPRPDGRPVPRGIPRPAGADAALSAYEVMRGADADAERSDPGRRLSPQEEFLTQRLGRPRSVEVEEEK